MSISEEPLDDGQESPEESAAKATAAFNNLTYELSTFPSYENLRSARNSCCSSCCSYENVSCPSDICQPPSGKREEPPPAPPTSPTSPDNELYYENEVFLNGLNSPKKVRIFAAEGSGSKVSNDDGEEYENGEFLTLIQDQIRSSSNKGEEAIYQNLLVVNGRFTLPPPLPKPPPPEVTNDVDDIYAQVKYLRQSVKDVNKLIQPTTTFLKREQRSKSKSSVYISPDEHQNSIIPGGRRRESSLKFRLLLSKFST